MKAFFLTVSYGTALLLVIVAVLYFLQWLVEANSSLSVFILRALVFLAVVTFLGSFVKAQL